MSGSSARKSSVPSAPGRISPSPNRGTSTSTPSMTTPRGGSKAAANGVGRSPPFRNGSPISARASVKKPGSNTTSSLSKPAETDEQEDGSQDAATIKELEARSQAAEEAAEDLRKQIEGLKLRSEEQTTDHNKLEEQMHEGEEKNEGLQNELKEMTRQKRELENIYEAERASFMKEQEAAQAREDQQADTIQRLRENMAEKEQIGSGSPSRRLSRDTSSPSLDAPHFAPSANMSRSNSRNNSKIVLQKDKLIESLRLELAEAQIKLVEMENMGGGQLQVLEKSLLEARMANARLMEDNESYQLLLSEKTLNGDFARQDILRSRSPLATDRTPPRLTRTNTLADELALSTSIDETEGHAFPSDDTQSSDKIHRQLQSELSALKDQNKALTVYINRIIERILQRQGGFENILSGADDGDEPPAVPQKDNDLGLQKDKELPPPPPFKDTLSTSPAATATATGGSFLERAKSVMSSAGRPKQSLSPSKPTMPSITDDPNTAPSIPLNRTQSVRRSIQFDRRATTDFNASAASVVSNMYKGPPGTTSDGPTPSPGLASNNRHSFFGALRTPSGNNVPKFHDENTKSATATDATDEGLEGETTDPTAKSARQAALDALEGDATPATSISDAPSPGRSSASSELVSNKENKGGPSVMMGRGMRPLRLVQEKEEDDAARKAANRSSWMPSGWFGGNVGSGNAGAKEREGSI